MLDVQNVSKSFNQNSILDDVSFSIQKKEVVALIGKNGSGKTTLLEILTERIAPDNGHIIRHGTKIGYLPQQIVEDDKTLRDYLSHQLGRELFEYEVDIALGKTNLSSIDLKRPINTLSGGQKTRLGIAALLIDQPDLLILDEPTNNLDSDGLAWLKEFILDFKGSIILTSHDRFFLDEVVKRTLELKDGKIKEYSGNYSAYKAQKEAEELAYLKRYEANQDEIRRLENRIKERRSRALRVANSPKQARDSDKMAADFFAEKATRKADSQAKALTSRLRQLDELESPRKDKRYPVTFQGDVASSHKLILRAENITKTYDKNPVLVNISLEINGNEHVLISGPNGSGKSTLLNIIAGKIDADTGSIKLGTNVKLGYFTQEVTQLNLTNSGFDELLKTGASQEQCYKQAKNLGITPILLNSPLNQLSRGQIAKIEVAKLLLQENDILILDEPTNHLDIQTREEIESALLEYKGALLIASHDQYFIETVRVDKEISFYT